MQNQFFKQQALRCAIASALGSAVLTCAVYAAPVHAEESCASILRECFVYAPSHASDCLAEVAKSESCRSNTLGALAHLRSAITTQHSQRFAVSLIGENSIATMNPTCLRDFDAAFASALIDGAISDNQVRRLGSVLKGCIEGFENNWRPQ